MPDPTQRKPCDLASLDSMRCWQFKAGTRQYRAVDRAGPLPGGRGGVLLARVTQLKQKGEQGYIGVATGMNALIRPALYGALPRDREPVALADETVGSYDVVGPICESGDVLGHDRLLPETQRGRCAAGRQRRRLRALDGSQLQPARAAAEEL